MHNRNMMRRKLSVIFFFIAYSCFTGFSQFEYYKPEVTLNQHQTGDIILSASPLNFLCNTPNGVQIAGGLKFQMFLDNRFSVDADLVFGRDYFHTGPGIIGIPLMFLTLGTGSDINSDSFAEFLFYVAAIALSFEHFSYHIPMKTDLDISPYVSLLRYKYAYEHGSYSDPNVKGEQLSSALGLQINKYFGRFILAPYAEWNMGYVDHISGYNLGVYCGIYFPVKKK
jgi:hypothetical protein